MKNVPIKTWKTLPREQKKCQKITGIQHTLNSWTVDR